MSFEDEVRSRWGGTAAYAEYKEKTAGLPDGSISAVMSELEGIFLDFSRVMSAGEQPSSASALALVAGWRDFITTHFYTCTDEILLSLGQMYVDDERFREYIDGFGAGTAEFVNKAIRCFVRGDN